MFLPREDARARNARQPKEGLSRVARGSVVVAGKSFTGAARRIGATFRNLGKLRRGRLQSGPLERRCESAGTDGGYMPIPSAWSPGTLSRGTCELLTKQAWASGRFDHPCASWSGAGLKGPETWRQGGGVLRSYGRWLRVHLKRAFTAVPVSLFTISRAFECCFAARVQHAAC